MDIKSSVYYLIDKSMIFSRLLLIAIVGVLSLVNYSCRTKADLPEGVIVIAIDPESSDGPVPEVIIDRIIPLESSDNSLIARVHQLLFFDNRYFIIDRPLAKAILVFEEDGRFINRTHIGRGPGELLDPFRLAVDQTKGEIIIHDQRLRSLIRVTTNLDIIRSSRYDTIIIENFVLLDSNSYLVNHHMPKGRYTEYSALEGYYHFSVYDSTFQYARRIEISDGYESLPSQYSPISIVDGKVYVIAPWHYSVYNIYDDYVKVEYRLEFGKYAFSSTELSIPLHTTEAIWRMINEGEKMGPMSGIQKTNEYMLLSFRFRQDWFPILYSLKTGITYNLLNLTDAGILPKLQPWQSVGQNSFLALVNPADMLAFVSINDEYEHLDVSENDNPYLIIFSVYEN